MSTNCDFRDEQFSSPEDRKLYDLLTQLFSYEDLLRLNLYAEYESSRKPNEGQLLLPSRPPDFQHSAKFFCLIAALRELGWHVDRIIERDVYFTKNIWLVVLVKTEQKGNQYLNWLDYATGEDKDMRVALRDAAIRACGNEVRTRETR